MINDSSINNATTTTSNNNNNPHPIATAAALMEPARCNGSTTSTNASFRLKLGDRRSPSKKKNLISSRKSTFGHNNPLVMAMITNNQLSSCRDVAKMMKECRRSSGEDQVCHTAATYMKTCLQQEEGQRQQHWR